MRKTGWVVSACAAALVLTACGGSGSGAGVPVADRSPAGDTTPSGTPATPAGDASAEGGDADRACLVSGSPWRVSTNDLESQFPQVMRTVNVRDVRITGGQTLAVDGDLNTTFTTDMVVRITIAGEAGLVMVMTQSHNGTKRGHWVANGANLTSPEPWLGRLTSSSKVSVNGRAATSPVRVASTSLADVDLTYACADGTLNMQVEGSPFSYLFLAAH